MTRQRAERSRQRAAYVLIGILVAGIVGLIAGADGHIDLRAGGLAFAATLGLALSIIKVFDQDGGRG